MDTDPTKVEDCCRPTKGRKDLQGEFAEHGSREALLELLFASVADAIFLAEPDGRIIDANPAACAMLGYAREELLGTRPWDFVTSASREEILELIRGTKRGGRSRSNALIDEEQAR